MKRDRLVSKPSVEIPAFCASAMAAFQRCTWRSSASRLSPICTWYRAARSDCSKLNFSSLSCSATGACHQADGLIAFTWLKRHIIESAIDCSRPPRTALLND